MTRSRTAPRLAAAALAGWSALSAAAPGVAGSTGIGSAEPARGRLSVAERALEADMQENAYRLFAASGFGSDRSERAAWVVRSAASLAWHPWPWDRRYLQSRWEGPPVPGAFAIVHTHPAVVDPRPSENDRATAARLGIAVYTVSRRGIWKAEPDGAVTRVGDERWWAGCERGGACRESAADAISVASAGRRMEGTETPARSLRITE